jgi:hypothetical protein
MRDDVADILLDLEDVDEGFYFGDDFFEIVLVRIIGDGEYSDMTQITPQLDWLSVVDVVERLINYFRMNGYDKYTLLIDGDNFIFNDELKSDKFKFDTLLLQITNQQKELKIYK